MEPMESHWTYFVKLLLTAYYSAKLKGWELNRTSQISIPFSQNTGNVFEMQILP